MPQPTGEPGGGGDQPVRGQGLVVVGATHELGIEIVAALQHLQGDIRPAGLRPPQFPGTKTQQQQQGAGGEQQYQSAAIAVA